MSLSKYTRNAKSPGRPRKEKAPAIRKGSIDAVNEAFLQAKAKQESSRMLPEPAIHHPDRLTREQKLAQARELRNAPVVKTERDSRTGIIIETLASGIVQVHVPIGIGQTKYHTWIGSEVFPDKYEEVIETDPVTGEEALYIVRK